MTDKLTIKQEKYVQGLFTGLTQREAYKQSYDCKNMTDKSVDELACRAAADIKLISRIDELTDELKYRNMATAERVLAEYAKIAFTDIKDFLSYGTVKVQEGTDDDGEPIYAYRQEVEARPSNEIDGTMVNEVSISRDGTFKFKLHDKKGALDMIGKYLGMFIDKSEITGKDGGPIELAALTPEERRQRIESLLQKRLTSN